MKSLPLNLMLVAMVFVVFVVTPRNFSLAGGHGSSKGSSPPRPSSSSNVPPRKRPHSPTPPGSPTRHSVPPGSPPGGYHLHFTVQTGTPQGFLPLDAPLESFPAWVFVPPPQGAASQSPPPNRPRGAPSRGTPYESVPNRPRASSPDGAASNSYQSRIITRRRSWPEATIRRATSRKPSLPDIRRDRLSSSSSTWYSGSVDSDYPEAFSPPRSPSPNQ
uniref:Putative proline-rich receptor-like protein kinase perk9 n=1 Tax=Amblyomma triste TaxID=251400 RepID=A0A023G666_AMBTT